MSRGSLIFPPLLTKRQAKAEMFLTGILVATAIRSENYETPSTTKLNQQERKNVCIWIFRFGSYVASCFRLGRLGLTIGSLGRSLRNYDFRRMNLPKAGERRPYDHKQYACGNILRASAPL
jgi:hypothetical protein